MRKAHIKIDRVVRGCWECPFCSGMMDCTTRCRIYSLTGESEPVEYVICTYHPKNVKNPTARLIGEHIKPNFIPDWCPFLEEADDEEHKKK